MSLTIILLLSYMDYLSDCPSLQFYVPARKALLEVSRLAHKSHGFTIKHDELGTGGSHL
jgi:hypothetical protein